MARFDNRIILVAGGASGIGAATALRLGGEGAKVIVGDINISGAKSVAERIVSRGGAATAIEYDQGDERSVIELVAQAAAAYDGLDGYFGNAAAMHLPRTGDFDVLTMQTEIWEQTMRIDLINHAVATREVLPLMLARSGGSIVYTASDAGFSALPKPTAYPCAKAALGALTRNVCLNHGKQGVRANCVSPGLIVTERLKDVLEQTRARGEDITNGQADRVNWTRLGTAEDVAAVVCFLLSDDAAYVNGQTISVNGGSYSRL